MTTLIARAASADPAAFTGERLTNAVHGQLEAEHYHRYLLAVALCRGRDVLDVATGEGYGAAMLAQHARSVIACDVAAEVIARARQAFLRPNLTFIVGDAHRLPAPDGSVDVVVCFEALEHFAEQDVFVHEVRRVLRPGGMLLVSTPDREVYSPPGAAPNPFHLHELTQAEFTALLGAHFAHVTLARQRAIAASAILPEGTDTHADAAAAVPSLVFEANGASHYEVASHLLHAPFLLACASDAALPPLPASLLILHGDLDGALRAQLAALAAQREAESAVIRLRAIEASLPWRVGERLQRFGLRLGRLARPVRRALRLAVSSARD
jgi:2-polyprenyl-3-methyl-5-hydroxy-6-metoxy-1,4-benzoquinol methylase